MPTTLTPPAPSHPPLLVDVVIEIPKDSRVKYELEDNDDTASDRTHSSMSDTSDTPDTTDTTDTTDPPTHQRLRVDRILPCSMAYPGNYGFVPNTLAEDGDAVDVVMLCEEALMPTCVVECRVLGYLEMSDSKGRDIKLIAVPSSDVAQGLYDQYQQVSDLPIALLDRVQHFFQHYKQLDATCWSKVGGFYGVAEANERLVEYRKAFEDSDTTSEEQQMAACL